MRSDYISARNVSCLILLITLSLSVMTGALDSKQNAWIAMVMSVFIYLPVILIYCRICALFPGRGLFEIAEIALGKWFGKLFIFFMTIYAIMSVSLVLRNFVEFTLVIALKNTPRTVLAIVIGGTSLYISKHGVQLFGRWNRIVCSSIIVIVIFTLIAASEKMDFSHMFPLVEVDGGHLLQNASMVGSIAIGEIVLVLPMMGKLKKGETPYKAILPGFLIGMLVTTIVVLRNLLILGEQTVSMAKFASYMAVRVLRLGSFLERIESVISFVLTLLGITKISLYLSSAARGAAKMLNVPQYRTILTPIFLLCLAICSVTFKNMLEMFDFARGYFFVAAPFQIVLPILLWIFAEIHVKGTSKKIAEAKHSHDGEQLA